MGIGYQRVDHQAFDYDIGSHPDFPRMNLRGPRSKFTGDRLISFIGVVQTFGRFVERLSLSKSELS